MKTKDYKFRYFFYALRLPFASVSLLNFIVCWLYLDLKINITFYLALVGILFAHLASNLWNDYFDYEADCKNEKPTPFSGGSRVLQEQTISLSLFFKIAIFFSLIAFFIGFFLFYQSGFNLPLLFVFLIAGLMGYFYTAPPLRLVYRGLGELVVFINFGPLILLGIVFLTQSPTSLLSWKVASLNGIFTAMLLFVNEFHDYPADKKANKKTLVVLLNPEKARYLLIVFFLISLFLLLTIVSQILFFLFIFLGLVFLFIFFRYPLRPYHSALMLFWHFITSFLLILYKINP